MNHFHSRLAALQFDLEAAANNILILAAGHHIDSKSAPQKSQA
jgi:biopolymer transport protein ExbB